MPSLGKRLQHPSAGLVPANDEMFDAAYFGPFQVAHVNAVGAGESGRRGGRRTVGAERDGDLGSPYQPGVARSYLISSSFSRTA